MKRAPAPVLAAVTACLIMPLAMARAETVLRLDNASPAQLDPDKGMDYSASILAFNLYDTLVGAQQGGEGLVPSIAQSWTVDKTSYVFTLRPDVKFHSGNALTADDVKYSFDRMMGVQQGFAYLFEVVQSVDVLSPTQVRFTLKQNFAPFLASLTRLAILDSKLVKSHATADDPWAANWLATNDAGSGAYSVVSHNPQSLTEMKKFAGYFAPFSKGAPDAVRMSYGLDPATVRTLIASGEQDIGSQWLPPEVKQALLARPDVAALQSSGAGEFYIKLNTLKPPLDDVHCRRALVDAFDYKTALAMVRVGAKASMGVAATGPLPAGMMGALQGVPPVHQDLAAAKAELKQCKYDPAQQTIEITWVAEVALEERFALLMQSSFAALGFKSTIVRTPWSLFSDRASKPETTPAISQIFITAMTPDPDSLIYSMYYSKVPSTWQSTEHLNDPEVDRLLDTARETLDPAGRVKLYQQLGARLNDLAPTIYAFDSVGVFPTRRAVHAPALDDPKAAFDLDGMGFTFRLMEMAQ